jgi:hypothetical protein
MANIQKTKTKKTNTGAQVSLVTTISARASPTFFFSFLFAAFLRENPNAFLPASPRSCLFDKALSVPCETMADDLRSSSASAFSVEDYEPSDNSDVSDMDQDDYDQDVEFVRLLSTWCYCYLPVCRSDDMDFDTDPVVEVAAKKESNFVVLTKEKIVEEQLEQINKIAELFDVRVIVF